MSVKVTLGVQDPVLKQPGHTVLGAGHWYSVRYLVPWPIPWEFVPVGGVPSTVLKCSICHVKGPKPCSLRLTLKMICS